MRKVWLYATVLLIVGLVSDGGLSCPRRTNRNRGRSGPAETATPVVEQAVERAAAGEIQDGGTLNYAYPQKFSPYGSFNPLMRGRPGRAVPYDLQSPGQLERGRHRGDPRTSRKLETLRRLDQTHLQIAPGCDLA